MANISLIVEGMKCGHCANSVKEALGSLSGVNNVEVDLDNKLTKVDFDDALIDFADMKEAISEAGYKVVGTK